MPTIKPTRQAKSISAPLAFHIRSLRQWHGTHGLSQEKLAALAGVSGRTVSFYESRPAVPQSLANLLSIALALNVPVERLIDPRQLNELRSEVDQRRQTLERCAPYEE